jgi:hypothetical protein
MVEINVVGYFNATLENKFNKDIAVLKKGDVALINITSHGGEVDTLKNMARSVLQLKQKGIKVATFVPDYAESAGFFFFLLGDEREMDAQATVHYHAPRVELGMGFVGTKHNLTGILKDITEYQDFTSELFKSSVNIDEDIFKLIENAELPMNRGDLQTLGIIN